MTSEGKSKVDKRIMAVVLIAGLACGTVLAVHLSRAREAPPASDPPLLESQRLPWDELHPEDASTPEGQPSAEGEAAPEGAPPPDGSAAAAPEEPDAADARVIREAHHRGETAGVTEYVELTEELFVRMSAQVAIMATTVAEDPDARNLLVDYQAQLLTDERVDPEEWYDYAIQAARDPERARELGEKILREAEKHTDMEIKVDEVRDLAPMPVATPEDE